MKISIKYSILILSLAIISFSSCDEKELALPPYDVPAANTEGGEVITIQEFKDLFPVVTGYPDEGGNENEVFLIEDSLFVKGVITANDISGNIYKEIYISDSTGGLKISINAKSLYLKYLVGQTVFLNCKGHYVGHYFEIPIFGGPIDGTRPGRLEENELPEAILLDGLPNLTKAEENLKTVAKASELSVGDLSKLVKITNVTFEAPGTLFGSPEDYPERTVVDAAGFKLVLSMSAYADFALDTIPSYAVDLTGILGSYQGNFQLKLRDANDVEKHE